MPYGFEIFIDESGDEGFRFRAPGTQGSSEWFILSAVMVPRSASPRIIETARTLRTRFGRSSTYPLHFVDLNHDQRVAWMSSISEIDNIRVASIIIHKPRLAKRSLFIQKDRLYFYTTRFLIERISWFCRDHHKLSPEGDGTARIIFSLRKSIEYEHLRSYLALLRIATPVGDDWLDLLRAGISIYWPAIKIEQVESAPHVQFAGLQMADAVTSGIRQALEYNYYGGTEHRYAKALHPITYSFPRGRGKPRNYTSYGLKFFPGWPEGEARCHWVKQRFAK